MSGEQLVTTDSVHSFLSVAAPATQGKMQWLGKNSGERAFRNHRMFVPGIDNEGDIFM